MARRTNSNVWRQLENELAKRGLEIVLEIKPIAQPEKPVETIKKDTIAYIAGTEFFTGVTKGDNKPIASLKYAVYHNGLYVGSKCQKSYAVKLLEKVTGKKAVKTQYY